MSSMERTFLKDANAMKLFEKAKTLRENEDHGKALEILDDMITVHRGDKNSWFLRQEQSAVFSALFGGARSNWDMEVLYLLGSLGCVTEDESLSVSSLCTRVLLTLGKCLGSVLYFKECIRIARQGLSLPSLQVSDSDAAATPWISSVLRFGDEDKEKLEASIKEAEVLIDELNTMDVEIERPPEVCDARKSPEPVEDRVSEVRSYWMGLDVKVKRDFMKVEIEKLRSFVRGVHRSKGVAVLEHVLDIAKRHKRWTVWVCRTKCDEVCFSAEKCKTHLEEKHGADFKPSSEEDVVIRIGRNWANKIKDGGWEPVDTVVAVEMIKTQLEVVKAFTTRSRKKGWSDQWPLAADEDRSGLLEEIKLLLVSLCEHQILSCSIRDWVMRFPVKRLGELEVSEESIKECRIVETPQSICFLERDELKQIRGFLKKIKCERQDGADHVCRAVEDLLDRSRIKENIDIDVDAQFSLLLLDKSLLKRNKAPFDADRDIKFIDKPDSHYDEAPVKGDDMISWLGSDHSSVDKSFPGPIREHNLVIWVAVLKALQYTCRTLRTKYAKKRQVLDSEAAITEKVLLIDAKILLIDNSRIRLLNNLTRLSAFDNRSYMLHFLKSFLLNEIVIMKSRVKSDAAEADLLLKEGKKKSQDKKTEKDKSIKKKSKSMASPVEQKPFVDLERRGTSQSPKRMEGDSKEPKDTLRSEKSPLEISFTSDIQEEATKLNSGDMQNMLVEVSVSENLKPALGGAATGYNSALDMTLKALVNINVLKEQVLEYNKQPVHDNLEEQVLCVLQSLFSAVVSEEIKTEGVYSLILRDLLVSLEEVNSMLSGAAEVLVTILEYWHCWRNSEQESLANSLFTLEVNERMSCRKCRRMPNYPDQSSYGIVTAADSIRDLKCAFGDIKFVDVLKMTRMNYKMLCDIKTGGCGTTNFVHHVISRCPPIFIIVLEWEKSDKEISETTEALDWEIDISRLYEGLEPNTNYRLVSMVGYGEENEEHICMVYEKNRWIYLRRESVAGEVVGNNWENVVRLCGEKKIRPVILLYEAVLDP